jgi:uncharacterized membrane protein YkoI
MVVAAALFAVALSMPALPVARIDSAPNACLTADEMHGAVNANEAVPPALAHRHAREAAQGDILRMRLCREDGVLMYLVTVLKRDGRVARVTIEAVSGKVAAVR